MSSVAQNSVVQTASTDIRSRQQRLCERYRAVRSFSERIMAPLEAEDCVIQSMPDVSPTRWHLAHTTWFFETFVLKPTPGFQAFDESFEYIFNSYYNAVGSQYPRHRRGLLSRPTVAEVLEYRRSIDDQVLERLSKREPLSGRELTVIELGLNHEQQHQELMLTDIKHVLSCNPLLPTYSTDRRRIERTASHSNWVPFDEGVFDVGNDGSEFVFDNELPRHRVYLQPFSIARRTVTCGEYLQFINDGGYRRPELWLSLGWDHVQRENWNAPLYWRYDEGAWQEFTMAGLVDIAETLPVCHVSYFEADAYARWAGARLATESEWETAATGRSVRGHFSTELMESGVSVHPTDAVHCDLEIENLFGNLWEWTSSSYSPYPGYVPADGALGEYNGKFMCNQYVLRGGSCATPAGHVRPTYRNFFPPEARWQFSGIRLAN